MLQDTTLAALGAAQARGVATAHRNRIIAEVADDARLDRFERDLAAALPDIRTVVAPAFAQAEGTLARFVSVELPGVRLAELPGGPHALAHDLADALDLATATPVFDAPGDDTGMAPEIRSGDGGGGGGDDPKDHEWHLKSARLPEAWQYSTSVGRPDGGAGMIVGQPDTGMAAHLLSGHGMVAGGVNLMPPPPEAVDPLNYLGNPGHGLSVGCTAASRGLGLDQPLRGAAPKAAIFPVRAVNSVVITWMNHQEVAEAVRTCTYSSAHVISMSLGGPIAPAPLAEAIKVAAENGMILAAAAGNFTGPFRPVMYPGWDPNTVAVAASTPKDEVWGGSCEGEAVLITAPGAQIWGPWRGAPEDPEDKIGVGSGTSYATALVAGLGAAWLAHHDRGELIRRHGVNRLQALFELSFRRNHRRPAGWRTDLHGVGLVDAEKMLRNAPLEPADGEPPLRAPERFRFTAETLISAGADAAMVARLGQAELERFGNEILWLSGPALSLRADDPPRRPSPQLAAALGEG